MSRRSFTAVAAIALAARITHADSPGTGPHRVGWLQFSREGDQESAQANVSLLRQALKDRGYVEGRNLVLDIRSVAGSRQLAVEAARDLVRLRADVIVVRTAIEAMIARDVAPTVPIVFVAVSDPVGMKLVDSLAHPGGNITGLSYMAVDLNPKRLEMLKRALPNATRVALLGDATHPLFERTVTALEAAAASLKLSVQPMAIRDTGELEGAFDRMTRSGTHAVLVLQSPHFGAMRERIVGLASNARLPSMFELAPPVEAGGLMSYGANVKEIFARTAYYVDRIVRGARPADLPVEQSTKIEFVVNLKTARALGLTIPSAVLLQADRLIE